MSGQCRIKGATLNVPQQHHLMRLDIYNRKWPSSQPILGDLWLSHWPHLREIRCCQRCHPRKSKTLAIAHRGHIYRCAPIMDVASTMTPVAGPNTPTAPALPMLPPPVLAVAIFCRMRVHPTDRCDRPCPHCHQIRMHRARACPHQTPMMPDSTMILFRRFSPTLSQGFALG
uniref:Uncharacterized protein n=1 Tax=Romanomermis culicivorax TaxID=13658 RepID=A0A915J552_ROMCU